MKVVVHPIRPYVFMAHTGMYLCGEERRNFEGGGALQMRVGYIPPR